MPVRTRGAGVTQPGQTSQVQNGVVPHVSYGRVLSVRSEVPLRPQPGRGPPAAAAEQDGADAAGQSTAAAASETRGPEPRSIVGQPQPAM